MTVRRFAIAGAALLSVGAALAGCGSDTSGSGGATGAATTTTVVAAAGGATTRTTTAAQPGPRQSLVGMWQASDGSDYKEFSADGRCTGMIYSGSQPMDIGGPMTCTLSSQADAEGRFTLLVRQSPNRATYAIAFTGTGVAQVYRGSTLVFTMTRQ